MHVDVSETLASPEKKKTVAEFTTVPVMRRTNGRTSSSSHHFIFFVTFLSLPISKITQVCYLSSSGSMLRSTLRLCQRSVPFVKNSRRALSFGFPSPKKLSEISDLDKLAEECPENIKTIWNIYHSDQVHANATTLTSAQHKKIVDRAKIW